MRRDKSLHEISGSARIAALLGKEGGDGKVFLFLRGAGRSDKQSRWENAIGGLDRGAVERSVEWQTRGSFCERLSFDTREIIPGWWGRGLGEELGK